jgi:two-component system chemotaxis response regulator CheY
MYKMTPTALACSDLRNVKVLVVDDDPITREFVESTLVGLHVLSVRSCADGFSALKILASFSPSVILTDIHMKPIDGFEFVRKLHSEMNPVRRQIPVIFMSSDSSADTLKSALPLGASGYIVKPPSAEMLRLKIAQAIHSHK